MALTALERMKQKRAAASSSDGPDLAKVPMGDSKWRVMPCWRKTDKPDRPLGEFALPFRQHWLKHPFAAPDEGKPGDKKVLAVLNSVSEAYGEDCPVGNMIAQGMATETDPAIVAVLNEAQGSVKYLMNLLCVEGPQKGQVVAMPVPMKIADAIFSAGEGDTAYNPTDGSDPTEIEPFTVRQDKGIVFKFNRTGAGMKTKYAAEVSIGGDMSPELRPVTDEEMAQIVDLDAVVTPSNDETNKAVGAMTQMLNPHGVASKPAIDSTATAVASLAHTSETPEDNDFQGAIDVRELGNTEGVDPLDAIMNQETK